MGKQKKQGRVYERMAESIPVTDWYSQTNKLLDMKNAEHIAWVEKMKRLYGNFINNAAAKYNVDPGQIYSLIYQESTGRPNAVSPSGKHVGLMQIESSDPRDFDPERNIDKGTKMLQGKYEAIPWVVSEYQKQLPRHSPSNWEAVAAYNWGQGNYAKYLAGKKNLPLETKYYVANVMRNREAINAYLEGREPIPQQAPGAEPLANGPPPMHIQSPKFRPDATQAVRPQLNQWVEPLPGAGVRVANPDGTFSSERSMGVGRNGREYVIPQLIRGVMYPEEAAIEEARKTGWDKYPSFEDVETARRYAKWRTNQLGIQGGDK